MQYKGEDMKGIEEKNQIVSYEGQRDRIEKASNVSLRLSLGALIFAFVFFVMHLITFSGKNEGVTTLGLSMGIMTFVMEIVMLAAIIAALMSPFVFIMLIVKQRFKLILRPVLSLLLSLASLLLLYKSI
jgi:hypothetical protein